jgi:hypothetical protein
MTEDDAEQFVGLLARWIRNALNQRLNPAGDPPGDWEEHEIEEMKQNIIAILAKARP